MLYAGNALAVECFDTLDVEPSVHFDVVANRSPHPINLQRLHLALVNDACGGYRFTRYHVCNTFH